MYPSCAVPAGIALLIFCQSCYGFLFVRPRILSGKRHTQLSYTGSQQKPLCTGGQENELNKPQQFQAPGSLLAGKVVCVTGATRGIGKGIALGLAEQGATVYVTGRSLDPESVTEPALGGTLRQVVDEIKSLGGVGIPMQVDHTNDTQVEELFKTIEAQSGRLDILVNNAFQLPSAPSGTESNSTTDTDLLFRNYWEQPGWFWDKVIDVGLRSHYVAACYATPLLLHTAKQHYSSSQPQKPLIVHVSSFGGTTYSFNVAYGVGKAGVDRMAKDMHIELQKYNSLVTSAPVYSIAMYPGIVRTERMVDILDSGEWERRSKFATPPSFAESPMLSGKALAALYYNYDGYLDTCGGKVCVVAEIAKRYGITDPVSGIIPPSIRSLKFLIPSIVLGKLGQSERDNWEEKIIAASPDVLLPMFIMGSSPPP